ncbi:MAG TPA: preprotein translocase subunit SecG [bacterium]|jgi:preprotein translocase subunit SecG|nr:preprotein translocase subunit SecG [bacterium]HNZ51316.1 preprotein translocase subunit SecG [bacterium]HOF79924.1 preprotein translocase subunit SecG [bacterium]HOH85217.1 preprotein translocase subunit SecG [bacterium]HOQ91343.1 preprotein translocase subunit SecG [bacterium]
MRWLNIGQIIVSILLILVILMQNRGSSMSSLFGGSGDIYRTKRGIEKTLFIGTIVLLVIFFGLSIANLMINQ